jgi:hypothetical protein
VILINRDRVRFVGALIEVLALAIWVEIALRRRPFDRVLAEVKQTGRRAGSAPHICDSTFERAIRAAYRLLPLEPTCLKHALIFCRVRRRRGLPAELRIGVRKNDGVFAAHAWLEDETGRPLTDASVEFAPLVLLPHEGRRNA